MVTTKSPPTKKSKSAKAEPTTAHYLFALKHWTIKQDGDKFFVAQTPYFNGKHNWSGPYDSLRDATATIARLLESEFIERRTRLSPARTSP